MAAAAAAMSAGLLCHYSAGLMPFSLRSTIWSSSSPALVRARELAAMAGVTRSCSARGSLVHRDLRHPHNRRSNTTVLWSSKLTVPENAEKAGMNFLPRSVPHPLRPAFDTDNPFVFNTSVRLGYLRDYMLLIYQHNLIFAMGLVGGPCALLLYRLLLARARSSENRAAVLVVFIVFCVAVGILVQGDFNGMARPRSASVGDIKSEYALAANFQRLRTSSMVIVAGLAADLVLGIVIHFAVGARSAG